MDIEVAKYLKIIGGDNNFVRLDRLPFREKMYS